MKIIVEAKDIKEVIKTARKWYGIILTEKKARDIIKKNRYFASEMYAGGMDTATREVLGHVFVEEILGHVPCLVHDVCCANDFGYTYWHWPINGSSEEYKTEFYKTFMENADKHGYQLCRGWKQLEVGIPSPK